MDIGNILQSVLGNKQRAPWEHPYNMSQTGVSTPEPVEEAKPRRSIFDIIGGIGDSLAVAGGEEPVYRQLQEYPEDRRRKVQQQDQTLRLNDQKLAAGDNELAGDQREQMGQALGGLLQSDNPAELWPQIAEAAGVPPEKAAQIGMALQKNPALARPLATAMGYKEPAQGSQPKEIQLYRLLQSEEPELADAYLRQLTEGKPMTAYQEARLRQFDQAYGLSRDKYELDRDKYENPPAKTSGSPKVPAKIQGAYLENNDAIRQIDEAMAAVKARPTSIGAQFAIMPEILAQRQDPDGVSARASISNIGSLKINERSGATVTKAESPRLRPFIPSVSDTSATVLTKLEKLKKIVQTNQTDIEKLYTGNFEPISKTKARPAPRGTPPRQPSGIRTLTPEQARNAPKGTRFKGSDGKVYVRQ